MSSSSFLVSGPHEEDHPGYDGKVFVWFIGAHRVEIRFTGTALAVQGEGLSERAEKALATKGESEVEEILAWKEPPEEIEFSTDNYPWTSGGERS